MAHPIYKVDGKRVPSVTTILNRFKDSGGLIHWAWNEGMEGRDYRESRDSAADAGTCAHAMVEAYIRRSAFDATPYPADVINRAEKAYGAFLEWALSSKLQPAYTETSLVSNTHRYGGTLDAVFIEGKLAIADWKTSNRIYSEMLCQVAAYGQLWAENKPDLPITGGYHIVRFDKQYGDFAHHWYPELDDALKYFNLIREAYEFDKALKARAA